MKEIRTKSTIKDIKMLDKASDMSHKMKNAYIRTKEQAEQTDHNKESSYVDDAVGKVKDGSETVGRKAAAAGEYGKNTVRKIKRWRGGETNTSHTIAHGNQPGRTSETGVHVSRTEQKLVYSKGIQTTKEKTAQAQTRRMAERRMGQILHNPVFQRSEKAALHTDKTYGQTGRRIKQLNATSSKNIKQAARGMVKTAQKRTKTAERSAKTAIKTSQSATRTAVKTAQSSQRAAQAARAATKAATASAKAAAKTMLATIKAIIAALKSLIALIAAGGWAAVVVILLICLVGLMASSVFGIFFSNEGAGKNTPVMSEAVSRLNGEFTAKLEQIERENPHDTLDLSNNGSSNMVGNWRDILAVYAVKVAADPKKGMQVATLDDTKVEILRDIFWDMNKIDYWLETIEHSDGETTSTETVLHIRVTAKSYVNMIVLYRFNPQQVGMVNELIQDKYRELFARLIGSYTNITLSPWEIAAILQNLPPDLDEQRKNVVLAAYSLTGKVSYFWGGKSTVLGWDSRWGTLAKVTAEGSPTTGTVRSFGLDCSGYVAWVFVNAVGNTGTAEIIGTGTSSQYAACTPVNWSSAQPGDLAFYPDLSHVGIIVGKQNGNLLIANCNAGENNVAVTRVSGASSSGFYMIGRPEFFE
ncbi:NlpC/P60 family protein [Dehalobacter sp.]|uniref:C40 family peptidase n=1 Tax=Dehalobacter sp. TaxID=1962289 RepID=UPI0025873BB6|nr:NlpC/P60 family protein [Dehalobacter sp.]MDJ0306757.1 NlpC/P60 family protein [Dehalobacter sp.]